jgi:gas vesicle protein
MRITSLILALVTVGALATFGQEGAVETVKQGAKKTGQKIKEGVETVGEKTKKAAETVGEKTKETAQTVGKKTKEAVETTGEKTTESTNAAHHKSKRAESKNKALAAEQQSTSQEGNTPTPSPSSR